MESNINLRRPDWLTDKRIERLRQHIVACQNPYTEDDPEINTFDGDLDMERYNAYYAIKTLTEYGIPFETA